MTDGTETLNQAKAKQSPAIVAEKLLKGVELVTDDTDTVFRHNGTFWEELSRSTLRQVALEADGKRSTRARREEIIDEIRARSHIRGLSWGRVGTNEMPYRNGVLDVITSQLRPHRPEDYLERVLPWDFRVDAQAPVWQEALGEWFGDQGDEEGGAIRTLQEFFGYCCFSHAKYKKGLLVYGPSDTGKSLIGFVLALMVGRDRTCSLPLEQMDDPQARAVIVGAALNLITEISSNALIADGGFKTLISTEEPVMINAKYKPPFNYYPTAKHVFITNTLPGLNDRTEAVLNRLAIIPMMRVFKKIEKDERLPEKLADEIPGILAWSVKGAKRLLEQRGQFSEVAAGADVIDELRRNANPLIDFIDERCVKDEHLSVPLDDVTDAFNAWGRSKRRPMSAWTVGKLLRSAGHVVKPVWYGKRTRRALSGFRLLLEVEMAPEVEVEAVEP